MSGKYKKIKLPDGSTIDEHRYIMEKHLGRKLTRNEVVHHIDEDKTNNILSNLQLMTREEHTRFHATGKIQSAELLEIHSRNRKGRILEKARIFSDEQIREIRKLHEEGLSGRKIAKIFNVSKTTIRDIIIGKRYFEIV
jgi:DNA-binding transcriptional regulator YiaG